MSPARPAEVCIVYYVGNSAQHLQKTDGLGMRHAADHQQGPSVMHRVRDTTEKHGAAFRALQCFA